MAEKLLSRPGDRLTDCASCVPCHPQVHPDVTTYNTLIKCECERGLFDQAYNALDQQTGDSIKKDIVTYNTMLSVMAKRGNAEEARHIYQELLDQGLRPSIVTLSCMVRFCERPR